MRPLKPVLADQVEQEAGEGDVVLDDEEHLVAGLDVRAVVLDVVGQRRQQRLLAAGGRRPRSAASSAGAAGSEPAARTSSGDLAA